MRTSSRVSVVACWLFAVAALVTPALLPTAADAQLIPGQSVAPAPEPSPADTIPADSASDSRLSAAADSVMRELRALTGYTLTEYTGEIARYNAGTGTLRLEGDAVVTRAGERLFADTIVFLQERDLIDAFGDTVRVESPQQNLSGQRMIYDLATRRAMAIGARTEVTESSATYYVTGDMTVEGTNRMFARGAHFTSCDLQFPHYHFESDEIMVLKGRILVARPARLYFGNVPVMWLPFVVQDLQEGRRSGLLTPRFGINDIVRTSSGYNRQLTNVGFYWAINEYLGAEVSTDWRSGAYTSLNGTLAFNWRRQFLSGNVAARRYWQVGGGRQLGVNAQSSWRPDERTSMGLSANYASSGQFVRQASLDPREVTQNLTSSLSISRSFDWGQISLGGDRSQGISSGDVTMTLPQFNISRRAITLFPSVSPETARWFNDITVNFGSISGRRSSSDYADNILSRQQDRTTTQFSVGPSISIGNLSLSTQASLNQARVNPVTGITADQKPVDLPGYSRDDADWTASAGYRIPLIATTSVAPAISLNQTIRRDTLSNNQYLAGPMRLSFGASLNTDLYGRFRGVGNMSDIRHRVSPFFSYSYAPQVRQSALQERVFGAAGGRTQNVVTFGLNQTFEGKLKTPRAPEEPVERGDSVLGDTIPQSRVPPVAGDPAKVTILSITTSSFQYDFTRAAEEGSGFLTDQVSNTIRSDYLRVLSIQMQHELFDRRDLEPTAENTGKLGRFAPRLSSLSTGFELGPQSAIFQWLDRVGFGGRGDEEDEDTGVLPGPSESDQPVPAGQGTFTGNNRGTGGGPWRASIAYSYTRPPRRFSPIEGPLDDRGQHTISSNMSFQLSQNWGVNWSTSYSPTTGGFAYHSLNFSREIHEWQANFSFHQTPTGNSSFQFYVQLLHNTDLRFDYAESELGIDRPDR